jgi:hypothetical protein
MLMAEYCCFKDELLRFVEGGTNVVDGDIISSASIPIRRRTDSMHFPMVATRRAIWAVPMISPHS